MNLISFFRSKHLRPEWTYTVKGVVWRVLFTSRGRIVGECRDQEKKIASFFCIDEESGKPLWEDVKLDEPWWVGLEAVQEDAVLLHSYPKPDMPEHKGIRAHDLETGTLRWRNDDLTYWFGSGDSVIAYRDFFEKRVGYQINLQTGELQKTHDDSLQELHALRQEAWESQIQAKVVLPDILDVANTEPLTQSLVDKGIRGRSVVGNIEFINEHGCFLFSCHLPAKNSTEQMRTYENHFFVYRLPEGERLFSEVVGRNLKGYVPDTFFVKRPRAFFIKDERTLTALRLWKS